MKNTNSIIKRTASLILSLVFVLTSFAAVDFSAIAATKWTPIASSDFTQAEAKTNDSLGELPTYNGMGKKMSWSTGVYTQNGNASKSDDGAIFIPDGYMYISGYEGGCVPINGCSKWKIDFGFRFKTDDSDSNNYENSDNYCFMKSYVYTDDLSAPAHKNNAYCHFCQNANGVIYSWENDGHNAGTQSQATSITTNNGNLVKGTNYHYVAEYTGTYFRTYITDEAGKVVQEIAHSTDSTLLGRLGNSATERINSFKIGDDDNQYFFKGLEYRNITFYSGDVNDSDPMPTSQEDKYLFAYFTGNSDDGENLRYAVSTDGVNFAPLNRGVPVTTITVPDSGEALEVYPTGTATSAWSTGNIRDPYVFKAQDGSYYILATDLNTSLHGFGNNSKMLVWHLNDLKDIDTTEPWAIDVTGMFGAGWVYRAWAPQAIWDPAEEKYMLYFAEQDDVHSGTVMYYVYTSDFKTFTSSPKRLVNYNDKDNIDGDITYSPSEHLYYLWYKNENTSTLGYATSPTCNGPYTNTQTIQANDGLEGCQVHQLNNGSYILLADAYGAGYFKVYPSDTLSGFSDSNILESNINYLSPRHGSVVRITTAEYNRLVEKFGVREYTADYDLYFSEGREWGSTNYTSGIKDSSGETYTLGATGGYKTTSGTLELNNGNLFIESTKARNILKGSAFTLTFKHKLTEEYKYTSAYNMITVGNYEQDFIALAEDGTFYVNGTACPNKANTAYNVESEYTICFNGSTVSLLQNGEYVTGALFNKTIAEASNGSLYVGLGWSDKTTGGRTTGTYSNFKLSPSATLTGHEDELLEEYLGNHNYDEINSPAQFNAFAYHVNQVASGGYSNVVYSPQNTTVFAGNGNNEDTYVNIGRMNFKIATPRTMVLVYDGKNEVSYPVVLEQIRQQSSGDSQLIHYVRSNESIFGLGNDWQGYTQTYTVWPTSGIVSSDSFAYYDNNNYNESTNLNNSEYHFYCNRMIYNGTGDTDKYYEVANNDSYYVKNSYKESTWGASRQYKYGDITSYCTRYVINYAPVYKMLSGETKVPGTSTGIVDYYNNIVKGNEDKYTPASVSQFYVAMAAISDANPNNYSFNATLSDVETCATNIKKAVTEFNKINLVERADFTELNAVYEAADKALTELGNSPAKCYTDKVSALVNAVNDADMYRLTETEKNNTAKAAQETINAQADAIESALNELTADAGRADLTAYNEAVEVADNPDGDIYSVSKQDTADIIEAVCDIIAGDDVSYTSISGDALTIPTVAISSDQSTVDIVTSSIISYMTTSIREYTITIVGDAEVSFTNNGSDKQLSENVYQSTYNNTAVFTSDSEDTAWYMEYTSETTGRDKQYQETGATYKTQVIGDITVYAVKRNPSKENKVTIVRDYMNNVYTVAQVDYVESSFKLPDAPVISGYEFVGYFIGDTKAEGTVDITKDTTICARYQKKSSAGYSVEIFDAGGNSIYAKENDEYNTKVTVSDNAYAWVEKIQGTDTYRPFYIGSELSFFVSESIVLKAVTKAQFEAYNFELPAINARQSDVRTESVDGKTKAYFNGQIVDDPTENAKILEYGYLVGKSVNRIPTENELTLENSGEHTDYKIIRAKSTKRVGANQFTVSVSKIEDDVIYRGYIVYQVGGSNGEIKTVYTDCKTLDI